MGTICPSLVAELLCIVMRAIVCCFNVMLLQFDNKQAGAIVAHN